MNRDSRLAGMLVMIWASSLCINWLAMTKIVNDGKYR